MGKELVDVLNENSRTLFAGHPCYLLAVSLFFLVAVCLLFPSVSISLPHELEPQLPQRSQRQRFVFCRGYGASYFVLFILLKDQSSSEQITGLKPTH